MTTHAARQKGIAPADYSKHVEGVLRASQAAHRARRRKVLFWSIAMPVAFVVGWFTPVYILAGLPVLLLAWFWLSCRAEAREIKEERNLP